MASDDMEFVDGLIVKPPHEKAPDFVKAAISIKVEDLGVWLRKKFKEGNEWVNIDVKVSKGGKWYAAVSKPKPKQEQKPAAAPQKPAGKFDDMEDDLPF